MRPAARLEPDAPAPVDPDADADGAEAALDTAAVADAAAEVDDAADAPEEAEEVWFAVAEDEPARDGGLVGRRKARDDDALKPEGVASMLMGVPFASQLCPRVLAGQSSPDWPPSSIARHDKEDVPARHTARRH